MAKKPAKPEANQPAARKGTYPYCLLKTALRVGDLVKSGGGDRVAVPKSVIAEGLEMDQGSSGFVQAIASAKAYGIVDGHTELRLTELGRNYYFPTNDAEKRIAELGFFKSPPTFQFLIEKFDGSVLPGPTMLSNLISREFQINDMWRLRVVRFFASTATELGILDANGRLRYDAARHRADNGAAQSTPTADMQTTEPIVPAMVPIPQANTVTSGDARMPMTNAPNLPGKTKLYLFADGAGRLQTPYPLPQDEWEELKSYVENVLKPKSTHGGTNEST